MSAEKVLFGGKGEVCKIFRIKKNQKVSNVTFLGFPFSGKLFFCCCSIFFFKQNFLWNRNSSFNQIYLNQLVMALQGLLSGEDQCATTLFPSHPLLSSGLHEPHTVLGSMQHRAGYASFLPPRDSSVSGASPSPSLEQLSSCFVLSAVLLKDWGGWRQGSHPQCIKYFWKHDTERGNILQITYPFLLKKF